MQFNLARRELQLKVVYYGPALSGKTTNLQALHLMAPQAGAGRLMTLETRDDRTLFFDLLPVALRTPGGLTIKIKLFTVPGQPIHQSTRRVVLHTTDGIVFVADSQVAETESNKQSFHDLRTNLKHNQLPEDLPMVIQFNKRDLPAIRTEDELQTLQRARSTPLFRAVAIRGEGVRETLSGLLHLVWQDLERRHHFATRVGLGADDFVSELFAGWSAPRPLHGGESP